MDNNHKNLSKISVVGAGFVGSTVMYALMLCDTVKNITLINRHIEKAQSELDDMRHGFPFVGSTHLSVGSYSDIEDSDLIVITVGRNRRPGETRLDMTNDNINIINDVLINIKKYYNNQIVIVVTNPIDIITKKVIDFLGAKKGKIFGTGTLLDSSRFISVLSDFTNVDKENIKAYIVGEHGDSQVPIWTSVKICDQYIGDYCKNNNIIFNDDIKLKLAESVRTMGSNIIKQKGKTQYGIATCCIDIINAINIDKKIKIPVACLMEGEFGVSNVVMSYPVIIGKNGIEENINENILKEQWSDDEIDAFIKSSEKIKGYLL